MFFINSRNQLYYLIDNLTLYGINEIDCMSITSNSPFDLSLMIIEIIAIILHILVFLMFALNKKFHSRHSIYLFNLSIIGFISIFNSLKLSDSKLLCIYSSNFYCQYQGLYFQFSIFVYSYSILGMAAYRFICVNYKNLNSILKTWKIILSIVLIWIVSITFVLVPKFASNIPVFYHFGLDACIENYLDRLESFWFFVVLGFIFPSISIAFFYLMIFLKIKNTRSRVANVSVFKSSLFKMIKKENVPNIVNANLENKSSADGSQTQSIRKSSRIMNRHYYFQLKLIIHFTIIYLTYLIYSTSNFLLIYQTTLNNIYWKHTWIELFKIFVSLYHLSCPIFYLGLHPITIEKFKKYSKTILNIKLC